jgi:hypothetical protein
MNNIIGSKKPFVGFGVFWIVFPAFLFSYYWFFIRMVFFDSSQVMRVFDTVRRIDPIGYDLGQMLNYPSSWLRMGMTPYIGGNLYPPLATVLFSPLINLNIRTVYFLITILTLICFLGIAFFFPLGISMTRKVTSLLVLIFVTGLTSYGFQFEMERGQFNIITMALCFSAIYLFHRKPKVSWLAYILFTIAIQLKLYPAIFFLFFVRDWKDMKGNHRRFLGLGFVNIALFFILGWGVFLDFLGALQWKANDPGFWVGNLSIRSFTQNWLPETILGYFNIPSTPFVNSRSNILEIGLLVLVIAMVVVVAVKAILKRTPGVDPYLLFICTCAALLIPPVSHDFKLPILAGPAAYLLMDLTIRGKRKRVLWLILSGLVFVFSLAYFSTQYSYVLKSPIIANNFPAVFMMMFICSILNYLDPEFIGWGETELK